jgi:hypothetical protein
LAATLQAWMMVLTGPLPLMVMPPAMSRSPFWAVSSSPGRSRV